MVRPIIRHQRGFTLLEIMIALAIFAIASGALIKNATQTVRQTRIIQDRTLAYWVASNKMNEYRIQDRKKDGLLNTGTDRSNVRMANRDWELTVDIEATENKDMRRILINVFNPNDLDNNVVELTGFVGKY